MSKPRKTGSFSNRVNRIPMATSLGDQLSPLAQLTCPSSVAHSSVKLPWDGFLLEHHRIPRGERPEVITDKHVLWLWTTSYSGEYAAGGGRFVRCSKGPGTITLTPAGIVPALRSYAGSELILCAVESDFVESIVSEADRSRNFTPIAQLLSAFLGRMKCEFREDLNLGTLAAESGYSRAHFLRMFRAATGRTPHQYLVDLRLEEAQRRMRVSSTALIDIAAACGFSSH
jgi:AraC-like DNA-binding protein